MSSTPALRIFSAEELKAATRNFHSDTFVGEGGFGRVYKGWIHEESSAEKGSGFMVAVKKLNHESMQGFQEWQVITNLSVQVVSKSILFFTFRFALVSESMLSFSFSLALTLEIFIVLSLQCTK